MVFIYARLGFNHSLCIEQCVNNISFSFLGWILVIFLFAFCIWKFPLFVLQSAIVLCSTGPSLKWKMSKLDAEQNHNLWLFFLKVNPTGKTCIFTSWRLSVGRDMSSRECLQFYNYIFENAEPEQWHWVGMGRETILNVFEVFCSCILQFMLICSFAHLRQLLFLPWRKEQRIKNFIHNPFN